MQISTNFTSSDGAHSSLAACCGCLTLALLGAAFPGLATGASGILLTGFGAESAGMAGVDVPMARDTTALNTNPAGLTQLDSAAADIYIEPFYALGNNHRDAWNTSRNINNRGGIVFGGGYARPFFDGRLAAGVGLFSQGGVGDIYKHLDTAFGTTDELSAVFGVSKLIPGIAWRVTPELRLGAGLGINYATVRQRFFPATSVFDPDNPGAAFFGTRFDDSESLSFNGKFGVQYAVSDRLMLAASYATKTPITLEDGQLIVNYEAIGLGRVTYRDASMRGISLPQELGLGARFRLTPDWLLAAELSWLNSRASLKAVTLTASDPDNSEAEARIVNRQIIDAKDQFAVSVAFEHRLNGSTVIRGGYHHVTELIPPHNLSPILALIAEDLFSIGFATDINDNWRIGTALEYQLPTSVSYSNAALPFGTNAQASNHAVLLTLMLSWRQ